GGVGDGRDTVVGRGGNDQLVGYRARGGVGDDSVDGLIVSCGPGRDRVSRGPTAPRGPYPRSCEGVLAMFAVVTPDAVRLSARLVEYALSCEAESCRGTLALRDRRGPLGRARFAVTQGGDRSALHTVRIRLKRRPAARIGRLDVSGPRA